MVIWITQTHSMMDLMPNYLATKIAKKKLKGKPFTESDLLVRPGSWGQNITTRWQSHFEMSCK